MLIIEIYHVSGTRMSYACSTSSLQQIKPILINCFIACVTESTLHNFGHLIYTIYFAYFFLPKLLMLVAAFHKDVEGFAHTC